MFGYVCYKKIPNLFYNQNGYCIIIETIKKKSQYEIN